MGLFSCLLLIFFELYLLFQLKTFIKIVFLLVLAIVFFIGRMLYNAGTFTKIVPHVQGIVQTIGGFEGAEDLAYHKASATLFVSSNDFVDTNKQGAIFAINAANPQIKATNLTDSLSFAFKPHGISLLPIDSLKSELYVVNHGAQKNTIERFEFSNGTLRHLQTYADPLFISPNDVLAIAPGKFYFSNDHNEPLSTWRARKDLLQIPMGELCYFDGNKASKKAGNYLYANGVEQSADGRYIFVAATSGGKIYVFTPNKATGDLTKVDEIPIHGADNLTVADDGSIWAGCHPNLLAFLSHSKDHSKPSPSEVVKITYKGPGTKPKLESIYLNDGKPMSGSSVALHTSHGLFVGSVFEDILLHIK